MFISVLHEVEDSEFLKGSTSTRLIGCVDLNFESFFMCVNYQTVLFTKFQYVVY